jgi:hypothetical protein
VFSSDWDVHAKRTYAENFGDTPASDIRKIASGSIEEKPTLSDRLWTYLQGYAKKRKEAGNGRGTRMKWEVQHYTLCDGWINTWSITDERIGHDKPLVFETEQDAQREIDEFLGDIEAEVEAGERAEDEGYSEDEFRIVEVTS